METSVALVLIFSILRVDIPAILLFSLTWKPKEIYPTCMFSADELFKNSVFPEIFLEIYVKI